MGHKAWLHLKLDLAPDGSPSFAIRLTSYMAQAMSEAMGLSLATAKQATGASRIDSVFVHWKRTDNGEWYGFERGKDCGKAGKGQATCRNNISAKGCMIYASEHV